jgi:tRNA (cmo5U34)-methyltransferase
MENTADAPAVADSRNHIPPARWEFDQHVTDCFDDMLSRSIPQYTLMRDTVFRVACRFAQRKTDIVDLGCSRGEALAPLISRFGVHNRFVGLEISQPMLEAAANRFAGLTATGVVDIRKCDLRHEYPHVRASVTMAILTLQFTPIEYRQQIVGRVFESTVPGGVFIVVEKVMGGCCQADRLLGEEYLDFKARSGYSQDDIQRKKMSLEGVLVPMTADYNEQMLRNNGFTTVECFWRWMNFAAWFAVKT